LNTEFYLFSV